MTSREKLAKRASKAGLTLSDTLIERLYAYFELLRKWNRKVSLTALPVDHSGDEALDRLLVEPVLAAKYLPKGAVMALDIGSGGGSPAIPMKLAVPDIALRMVESKTRKAAFLREAIRSLELDRTTVEAVRFEELLARPALHDAADVVTIRAVRIERKTLVELQSFIRPGGLLFLFTTTLPVHADELTPHLVRAASHLLLPQWGSHLQVLEKARK